MEHSIEKTLLSLDMSTTSTGYAVFLGHKLQKYGVIKGDKSLDWKERVKIMAVEIKTLIDTYKPDKIVAEDIPLKKQGGMSILVKLGCLQGILLALCGDNIELELLTVGRWRHKVGLFDGTNEGKERAMLKKHSIEMANVLFKLDLIWKSNNSSKNEDDISDAILIGHSTFIAEKEGIGRKAKVKKDK